LRQVFLKYYGEKGVIHLEEGLFAELDGSPLINFLFYPRSDFSPGPDASVDLLVKVQEGVSISCRLYSETSTLPWVIYFHGNGEVVSDYNYIAPMYNEQRINLAVADYRGYGKSGGKPSFSALLKDARIIFKKITEELQKAGYKDKPWVMGRSLGSIPTLELASAYPRDINGLIIESGFINPGRLLKHLGLPSFGINFESIEQESIKKVRNISIPALVLHGHIDNLVPLSEGEDLYTRLGSNRKEFVVIPEAGHNDIMFVGKDKYFAAIQNFIKK
jgi:uncharacterized protein